MSFTSILIIVPILLAIFFYIKSYLRIRQTEREFTLIVNHVFRTPLTRILWLTKELNKELPREEKMSYVQNIENSANRVMSIVDLFVGIKDIEERSSYLFQAVSVRDLVEKSMAKHREIINQKKLHFEVGSFKDAPLLTLDLKKISFVIDVLIENAISYTQQDGAILINCETKNNSVLIYVSDTGLGLSIKDKWRIFSKFYRGTQAKLMNTDGVGLGLYLAKIIVTRHKGKIYAKSKGKNKGSTFFIELPYSK